MGGFKWEQNPNLGAAQGYAQQGIDAIAGEHSKGENYWKRLLRGEKQGNFGALGNPFLAETAAANRLAQSHSDPFLPPELAAAQTRNAEAHNNEQMGINFESYVRNMLGQAAQGTNAAAQNRAQGVAQGYQQMGQNELNAAQGHQTQGWGSMLMSGLGMAAGAASGLGWQPFK